MSALCESCGSEYSVGDWPFCGGDSTKHRPAKNFGDDPIDSYFDEHVCPDGAEITTRGQRRKLMAENCLEVKPKRYSVPGSRLYFDMGKK